MSSKQPKVGDRVRLKQGTISYVFHYKEHGGSFHVGMEDGTQLTVFGDHIEEIIPAPWTPVKGDIVFTRDQCLSQGVEVQAIYGDYILLWWRDQSGAPWVCPLSVVYKDKEFTICAGS